MKKLIIILFLLPFVSNACINGSGMEILGEYKSKSLTAIRNMDLKDYQQKALRMKLRLERDLQRENRRENWNMLNQLAICDIFLGNYADAKKSLFKAAKLDGFNYSVNSNLGVIYELEGNLDSAYYYTSRALQLNYASHHRSEWIHVKILEAEMMEQKSPGWINSHSILSLDQNVSHGKLEELVFQINFQLSERMIFVKPQNKFVANILFTHAQLMERIYKYNNAIESYKLAAEYDKDLNEACDKLILNAVMKSAGTYDKVIAAKKRTDTMRESLLRKKLRSLHLQSIYAVSTARLSQANLMVLKAKRRSRNILFGSLLAVGLIVTFIIIKKRSA